MKDKVVVLGAFIISILILVLIKSNEYFTGATLSINILNIGFGIASEGTDTEIKNAVSIALDNNNNIFVLSTRENGILYKISPSYAITTELSTNLSVPQKIAFDPSYIQ